MYGIVDEIKSKSCFLSSSEMLLRRKYLSAMTTLNNTAEETEGNQGLLACPILHVNIFSDYILYPQKFQKFSEFTMIFVGKHVLFGWKTPFCHTDAARYPYRKARFSTFPIDADLRHSMTIFF